MSKIAEDKKTHLARAAVEVIAREGFHNATIDKISSHAGVSVGTIYNYFLHKNDILDYIFKNEYEKRKNYFMELKKTNIHPLEKLKRIMEMHFMEVKKHPSVFIVLLRERGMPKVCHFAGISQFEGLPGFIEDIMNQGVDEGTLRPCDVGLISLVLFGAIEALMSRYLLELEKEGSSKLLDNAAEETVTLLYQGLRN